MTETGVEAMMGGLNLGMGVVVKVQTYAEVEQEVRARVADALEHLIAAGPDKELVPGLEAAMHLIRPVSDDDPIPDIRRPVERPPISDEERGLRLSVRARKNGHDIDPPESQIVGWRHVHCGVCSYPLMACAQIGCMPSGEMRALGDKSRHNARQKGHLISDAGWECTNCGDELMDCVAATRNCPKA
jgi:hypothetical protein